MVEIEGAAHTATALGPLLPQLALLLDFDGTLSPIVADPDAARADPAAAEGLARLAPQAALLACVTGRPALIARRLLGVAEIAYTGLHGAQVLAPGAAEPTTPAAFADDGAKVHAIVAEAAAEPAGLAGLEVEDKGPIRPRRSSEPRPSASEPGRRDCAAAKGAACSSSGPRSR
jgi:trehalose 6-phosphate phosphatase